LPDPPGAGLAHGFLVFDIAAHPVAGVLWLRLEGTFMDGTMSLVRWDGASTTTLASFVLDADAETSLAVSATEAFVLTHSGLYAVPLDGGAAAKLRDVPAASFPQIVAIDESWLFYSPEGTSIVRRDLASEEEITLAEGLALEAQVSGTRGWADATWLYFATGDPQSFGPAKLLRMSVVGGAAETLWDVPDRHPTGAVATDACNVYWLAASAAEPQPGSAVDGPSILMFRRK
jgi:hypothetical protein